MNTGRLGGAPSVGLALLLILTSLAAGAYASDGRWLATGTVTKVDGSTIYFLGRDNQIYTIAAGSAQIVSDLKTGIRPVMQGDTIRVYGSLESDSRVIALRIRILKGVAGAAAAVPEREIKIIYERPQPDVTNGAGPAPEGQAPAWDVDCTWESRGLITDIDYDARQIKLRTSTGQFTVNINGSLLVQGNRRVGLGRFSLGDAVSVSGNLVRDYEINAARVTLMRTKYEGENILPQKKVAIGGVIQQIDYPSMTFTMRTETTPITVMADQNTIIQQHQLRQRFTDLRPGMHIKMNGNGSLGTGYAAREILIVGVAP